MAELAGAQAAAQEAGGWMGGTSSYWVDGKNGKAPWSHRKVGWLVAVPLMALLIGIATTWAVFHIQNTLEDESRRDLAAAGIDPSGLTFDYDYRSGTATGTLPSGATAAGAEAAVDDGLLKELTILAEPAAAPATVEPATPPPAPAPVEVGPTEASAQLIDGSLVLSGVVLTDGQRAALVDAASAAVGAANVRDELTVSGVAAATDGADERVAAMAGIIGALGGAESATVALSDTSLDVTALAAGVDSAGVMEVAASGSPIPGAVAIDVVQGPTEVGLGMSDGTIIPTGSVLNDAQRIQLIEAAANVVGAGNVEDQLEVSGLAEATAGADDRVAAFAGLISQLSDATTATGSLSDANLTLDAITQSETSAQSIVAAGGSITATEATVTASAAPVEVEAEIVGLQADLDGLAAEIRESVVFGSGDAGLSAEAQATLDKVTAAMIAFPQPVVEVSGHTDSRGNAGANEALSAERAASVVAYLVAGGVGKARLRSRGVGEAEPIGDNNTSGGRAENRRVEFTARERF